MNQKIAIGIKVFFLSMLLSLTSVAQEVSVTGKVTDFRDGSPLIGVNVIVKGTTIGTVTDFNGNYTITAPTNSILVFSYLGYDTDEQEVGSRSTINVGLYEAFESLEEIIVIGYGTQKKSDRTGAITHIRADELNQGVLTDAIQSIQGKAAGVIITKQGGDPNAGFDVRIRGASSLSTSTSPLYVIDGVPGADPTTVAPEDIESFNILKDASAAAIYGSRGANGVIIITTKRGKQREGSVIEFNNYLAFENTANRLDLLSAQQFRKFINDNPSFQTFFIDGGASTDWQDEIYRTGYSNNHMLAVSGGDKNTFYRTSLAHSNFTGVIKGSEKTRTTARLNLDQKALNNKLTLSSGISGTFENNQYISYGGWGPNQILYQAFQRNPTDPVKDENGEYYEIERVFQYYNPVNLIEQIYNEREAKRFFGYMKADLEIVEGLVAGANLAYTRNDDEGFYFEPTTLYLGNHDGYGNRSYNNFESRILETTLSYQKDFGRHSIQSVAGYSFQEDFGTGFRAQGRQPFINYPMMHDMSLFQNVKPGDISSYKWSSRLISFFARGIYNLDNKYYLTATIRRDGSSKFGKNNEWGWFPSASLMWNMTGEDFMKEADFVNNLRLRAGFGITGNQEIGVYNDIPYYRSAGNSFNFETGEQSILFEFSHAANPDLKWEENSEINIGVDFGFLRDRISGSFEFFQKNTVDLLGRYSVPVPPNPIDRIWANVGHFRTTGFEIFLQGFPVSINNFKWRTALTFTTYKQEVVSLSKGNYEWTTQREGWLSGPGLVGDLNWTQIVDPGYPLGTFYLPEYAGLVAGKFVYYVYYEDGTVGYTDELEKATRRNMGNAQPDFEMGWSNYFDIYRNWDFSFSFRAVYGHQIFNTTRLILGNPTFLPDRNVLVSAVDEWNRGLRDNPKVSSYYLEDGSFIRLDNLSLGYNLKKFKGIDNIRFYFAMNNVFTITNYSGIDPEINFSGLSFGLDQYNIYPKTRTLTFGINFTL